MDEYRSKEELEEKILNYLRKHPDAADTVEGITGWWLESQRIDESVDKVFEILEVMCKKKLLYQVKYENGPLIYRVLD